MYSNREKHTPEAESSPDESPTSDTREESAELWIKLESPSPPNSSRDVSPMPATSKEFAKLQIKSESPPTPEPYIESEYPPTPEPRMQRPTSSLKRSATDELSARKRDGSKSFGKVRRQMRFEKEEDLQDSKMAMKEVRQPLFHT
jgi:hypothetical protein